MNYTSYPNPVSEYLYIQLEAISDIQLSITDQGGKIIMTETYKKTNTITADIRTLPKGLYYLHLNDGKAQKTAPLLKN